VGSQPFPRVEILMLGLQKHTDSTVIHPGVTRATESTRSDVVIQGLIWSASSRDDVVAAIQSFQNNHQDYLAAYSDNPVQNVIALARGNFIGRRVAIRVFIPDAELSLLLIKQGIIIEGISYKVTKYQSRSSAGRSARRPESPSVSS
jgi:hypothetical protein